MRPLYRAAPARLTRWRQRCVAARPAGEPGRGLRNTETTARRRNGGVAFSLAGENSRVFLELASHPARSAWVFLREFGRAHVAMATGSF